LLQILVLHHYSSRCHLSICILYKFPISTDAEVISLTPGLTAQPQIAYYYTEPAHSLSHQAYDDRLWVALNWLESIKTIRDHSDRHYRFAPGGDDLPWHGEQFIPAFAHRARKFWEFAAEGWDEKFCGGGMLWNPRFAPYKNAVTNELSIAASVGIYLHYAGENINASWQRSSEGTGGSLGSERFNRTYLHTAIRAYDWLQQSNMTNDQGLYVDGYHISHLRLNNTICDVRNEMIYTYNQGILLSGLRDLWEATGNITYLLNAHALVSAVINATGWDLASQRPELRRKGLWAGLGEGGILQDRCDVHGACNQDAQMFKGIFLLHFAAFCQLLPVVARVPGRTFGAGVEIAALHRRSCGEYRAWVEWNARGALGSRDEEGRMGGWWGGRSGSKVEGEGAMPEGAVDYRNDAGELLGEVWQREQSEHFVPAAEQQVLSADSTLRRVGIYDVGDKSREGLIQRSDPKDRGRGRTVETHSGGVAVLRALWELKDLER